LKDQRMGVDDVDRPVANRQGGSSDSTAHNS
jgi:hypothetical protein